MVAKVDKYGSRYHAPPYTKAEEAEFYSRDARGPVTVVRSAGDRKAPKSRALQQPPPAKGDPPRLPLPESHKIGG
jgi:hypothetical protein